MRIALTVLITLLISACANLPGTPPNGDVETRIVALEGWRLEASSRRESENGVSTILTEGELFNETGRTSKTPTIRLGVYTAASIELYHWSVLPDEQALPPGGRTAFTANVESPPPDVVGIRIEPTFAD